MIYFTPGCGIQSAGFRPCVYWHRTCVICVLKANWRKLIMRKQASRFHPDRDRDRARDHRPAAGRRAEGPGTDHQRPRAQPDLAAGRRQGRLLRLPRPLSRPARRLQPGDYQYRERTDGANGNANGQIELAAVCGAIPGCQALEYITVWEHLSQRGLHQRQLHLRGAPRELRFRTRPIPTSVTSR